jgi:hypothetical protein
MKIPQSQSDLVAALQAQVGFLRSSSATFDAGNEDEALRLATTTRVLVHQTGQSHALLQQLGLLDTLQFLDTAVDTSVKQTVLPNGRIQLTQTMSPGLLAGITIGKLVPLLGGEQSPSVPFLDWWTRELVPSTATTPAISRRWLVTTMANQAGGAHVDPKIDAHLLAFIANRVGMNIESASPPIRNSVAKVAMRQIAHELLATLNAAGHA